MSLEIEFIDEQDTALDDDLLDMLHRLLQTAADMEEVGDGELAVTFVDDEAIQRLNRDYRGIDKATDVLSFAMSEQGEEELPIYVEDEELPNMLGDIVVSIPRTIRQAEEYGHSFERELGFLVVHGFLHLLGYDHQDEHEEKQMFSRQEEILSQFGLHR